MENTGKRTVAACTCMLALVAGPAAAEAPLGEVRSVTGEATARRGDETPRVLGCGDPVYAGDVVTTAADARVGLQTGDLATQLAADSRLRLDRLSGDLPSVTVERGKARMVDPREDGTPARLAALDASASVAGNDAEAYVFAEKVGPYAMLCEWDADLPVARADEHEVVRPGECVISKPTEPLYTARAHDARIPVQVAEICEVDPDAIASLAGSPLNHLSPADVAAPPPLSGVGTAGLGFHNPKGADMPTRAPCDVPGAGCVLPVPATAVEPPPVGGGFPGSP